ncbi:MAG: PAS domain S-box protein [Candidatus Kryptoniota bacterium]
MNYSDTNTEQSSSGSRDQPRIEDEQGILLYRLIENLSNESRLYLLIDPQSMLIVKACPQFYWYSNYNPDKSTTLELKSAIVTRGSNIVDIISSTLTRNNVFYTPMFIRQRDGNTLEFKAHAFSVQIAGKPFVLLELERIIERPQTKEYAELQRVRYENFIQNSAEGIWRIEFTQPITVDQPAEAIAQQIAERSVIVECNVAMAKMYGFDEPSQLIGRKAVDFIEDLEGYISSKIKFVQQNFSVSNIESTEKDASGNIHYFENSYLGEISSDRKLIRIWGIQRDITEKRRLQEQLRASENRYRNLVEQANDMVILLNQRGEFLFANKRFFEITKFQADEIWGKPFTSILHVDNEQDTLPLLENQFLSPQEGKRFTIKLLTKFHEERMVEFSMTPIFIGEKITGNMAIGRDVTDERNVLNALHESEEKYRSLVEHTLLGVMVIQNDLIVYANHSLCELFEVDLDMLQNASLDNFIHPNDFMQLFEKLTLLTSSPKEAIQFTIRVLTPQGKTKILDGWGTNISYLGKPAVQIAFVDVTEKKRLEEQLIQAQKMESIGQLASGIAHDFNNLLGSIYGAIEIIKRKQSRSGNELKKYIDILDSSAQRAAELTSQLLTFSRQRERNLKPLYLNNIVQEAMNILIRSLGKNIRFESALDQNIYAIEGDSSQIEQVILNLCINSRDAMPNGGVLRIETSNVDLSPRLAQQIHDAKPGKYVCLTVSDTGVGMDQDTQRKIFEPFFTTKPIGKGTGLGLSIVYGIIKDHNGFIKLYSEVGRGTTFKIFFPATNKIPLEESTATPKEISRGNETILIIDDEETLLDLTREILENLGYKIITARGAMDGIETFRSKYSEIDLVILDMMMPEMTGREVYPVLKSIDPEVKVLLATGLSVGERVDELLAMGVTHLVSKPYSVDDLATQVRQTIDEKI